MNKGTPISFDEARAYCVRYYEGKYYSKKHAEAYISHDPEQVLRVYDAIQKEEEQRRHMRIEESRVAELTIKRAVLDDDSQEKGE